MTGTRTLHAMWPAARYLRWLGVAVYATVGLAKLLNYSLMVEMFQSMGLDPWTRYAVGGAEVLGAALLLIPRSTRLAALGLAALMVGAAGADVILLHRPPILSALMLLAMICLAWESGHARR